MENNKYNPDLLKVMQGAEATKESDLQKVKEEITPEPIGLGWAKASERLPSGNGGKYFVKFRESKCVCHFYNGRFQSIEWGLLDNNALIWLDESAIIDDWISVGDQLPAESGRYWCYVEELTDLGFTHFQWNCYFDEKACKFSDSTLIKGENVTHWRLLPAPPSK